MANHKTEKSYWDDIWAAGKVANKIDPRLTGIRNYTTRAFHSYFNRVFFSLNTKNLRLLEVGCANSVWLPYFSEEFDFNVDGLDYSEIGCDRVKRNLAKEGVHGDVICADMFSPPPDMLGSYDVVVSFGVVEHFEDTSKCIQALSKFLKKDGLLITSIPNLSGLQGYVQKHINRAVFDIHNPMNKEAFMSSNKIEGYEIIECDYFMSTNFGVCNLNGVRKGTLKWVLKKIVLAFLVSCSVLVWLIEDKIGMFPVGRLFSPYINCVVIKK